ncbi:MAG: hypothetical protein Q9213_001620 [Squamulea squamosa]
MVAQVPLGTAQTDGVAPKREVDGDKLAGTKRLNPDGDAPVRGVMGKDVLHITDGRTGLDYDIPITSNSVRALDFLKIKNSKPSKGTLEAADITQGLRLLDPGFQNTAVKESKITFVYSIRPDAPPIPVMIAALSSLAASQPEMIPAIRAKNLYMGEAVAVQYQIIRALANAAYITAAVYCHRHGRELSKPDPYLSFVENILSMMGHVDKETGRPNPKHVDVVQRLWTLMADHEMTNSTAAFLHTASTLSDPIMNIVSGLASSWGILHGGAIEVGYRGLERLGDVSAVPAKIEAAKSGKERLFGYGHRIYKVTDPRYIFIRNMLNELVTEDTDDKVLAAALELDKAASSDDYFTSRKLNPNADFFASFVYKAL